MQTRTKKKLAFIDHSFHRVTRSSEFFQEILRYEYEITVFFDDAWRGGPAVDPRIINAESFDVVLFWQSLPSPFNILRLTCKNLVWVPMYDSEQYRSPISWRALRRLGLKVICFSEALYEITRRFKLSSLYAQYFPEPLEQIVRHEGIRVFLWQRVNKIDWPLVKRILTANHIDKIVLKADPDPNFAFTEPTAEDIERFGIEVVRDLKVSSGASHADYLRLLSKCNVFIAPRLAEGIGMAFLEAMAMGMCVVGPDRPTMNEYIIPGNNGFLFDPRHVDPIDLANFAECGRRARTGIAWGRQEWQSSSSVILQFVSEAMPEKHTCWNTALAFLFWEGRRVAYKLSRRS
jgi:glycosyltransferase involved in cell wall biosynthesis